MEIESKQPHSKAILQRGRQILERRKELDPIRKRPPSNGARQKQLYQRIGITPVAETAFRYGAGFPHEVLGGISPADLPAEASAQAGKLLEHQSKNKKSANM
ncbi:MAG: hypothetical protein Q8P83_00975 [bacterium]|nr:hypothetical protein [bacterium]